jgi:hypothetical protein
VDKVALAVDAVAVVVAAAGSPLAHTSPKCQDQGERIRW